jgi:hypothetical protein
MPNRRVIDLWVGDHVWHGRRTYLIDGVEAYRENRISGERLRPDPPTGGNTIVFPVPPLCRSAELTVGAELKGSATWKEGLTVGLPSTTGVGSLFFQVGLFGNRYHLSVDEARWSQ